MGDSLYSARGVCVSVRGRALLTDVDLDLRPGTVTVLVGPNGAGKSTLLKAMTGETRLAGGSVTLDGQPVHAMDPRALARRRAVLPQSVEVAFPFTVAEVVGVGLMGVAAPQEAAKIEHLLGLVDLPGFSGRRYDSLSGGERQRVQLARVLAQLDCARWAGGEAAARPAFLFLDEPTASLDLGHQLGVLKLARAHAQAGGGVLAVLHDLNLAAMVADRLVVLARGRLVAEGTVAEVLTDDVLERAFGVRAQVGAVPTGPFVLPQSILAEGLRP